MKRIPVLMYHALENSEHPANLQNSDEQLYVLNAETFRSQIELLWRYGYKTALLSELMQNAPTQKRTVVITFDDGHQSNYTIALPILRQFNYRAEFFITTNRIGTANHLSQKQIAALHDAGMGIGSHGTSHNFFDELDWDRAEQELLKSSQELHAITGQEVAAFSAPGGRIPNTMEQLARQTGYTAVCTSYPSFFTADTSQFNIPRFAMRQTTTMNQFTEILEQNHLNLIGQTARSSLLNLAKHILGSTRYQMLRHQLLKGL
jgi:peptidoglycan/xylan/chitin deacetylase (PgdA/CDA1 family)